MSIIFLEDRFQVHLSSYQFIVQDVRTYSAINAPTSLLLNFSYHFRFDKNKGKKNA